MAEKVDIGCGREFPQIAHRFEDRPEPSAAYDPVTDDDHVVIGLAEIKALGSMAAIEAHFASADIMIPPLKIAEREADHG